MKNENSLNDTTNRRQSNKERVWEKNKRVLFSIFLFHLPFVHFTEGAFSNTLHLLIDLLGVASG
jgi:hypothetical protein